MISDVIRWREWVEIDVCTCIFVNAGVFFMKNILQLFLKAIIEMALGSWSEGSGKKDIGHRDEL